MFIRGQSMTMNGTQDTAKEENDHMIAVMLSQEYAKFDGTFGSYNSNPNTIYQSRLLETLNTHGLCEVKVPGDGNCQFSALSQQIYGSTKHHMRVRDKIMKHLRHQKPLYESYVTTDYKIYCKRMKRCGEWGDHVTLQAAADKYEAKICVLTSSTNNSVIEIMPQQQTPNHEFWLSFSGIHYNSLHPIQHKPRRKFWLF
ncbi:PREDICTED: OTU domain-containing protein DDB_G0284757-like [Lupinus angustifolius]|uniref:OTU domain-containing protein DDB_G0284757-like n=1 Tax=Lupinus angustifolius TaxID=3871 RepID=UPI00092E4BBF|nr:PREDICTED: OTU domain-containing protein DDB_G0284757-like [Lupinus angustifolius]